MDFMGVVEPMETGTALSRTTRTLLQVGDGPPFPAQFITHRIDKQ
jgi:hypothetical protein